ncbi:DUF4625 domain-containing protein [Sphingobacterium sp. N143]|uniref:DUF4625 domain-containing protein n=1 Tax=Sphingobacterium sp. N143 TaxID=2746727 RepID=UPI0025787C29|nr:DUF4625 domain-containing protein [Sphingobacterium sp. N143]MDM1296694.1 DUF4625 domain-containing protein [Sphingobacterium sp. N143]
MKTTKIGFITLFTMLIFGLLSSCKKDNDDIPALSKPTIDTMEIGTDNSKTAAAGADLHLEGNIVAEALIDKIAIDIHQEGGGSYKITKTYTEGKYVGVKNAVFHEHIDIPSVAPAGEYHLHFTVTDKAGNSTTVESPLTITAAAAKAAFKLVFTEVKGEAHGDHFHDLADIEGVEPLSVNFDASGEPIGHGHFHISPSGIYRVELKQYDATGAEIQGQYIKDKATADSYKAFITGGAFILNPNSENATGAIFQPKETTYSDGTAIPSGAIETTGIISYFTAGAANTGEKEVKFVLRKLKDKSTKAKITRTDWNLSNYEVKFPGEDVFRLSFELHAEDGA